MATPENLSALENLMNEFFDGGTSNERKREIEKMLEAFGQQKSAWRECLYFMANTSNQYVCMFTLTTLENIISKQWIGMQGAEKSEIRTTLNLFLSEHHRSAPPFIRNKLMKLIVDVARTDWPHFYPDFFVHIHELLATKDAMLLGLGMLLIASEELATPRDNNISTARKAELRKLVGDEVPYVLNTLTGILNFVSERTVLSASPATATPPPSPCPSAQDSCSSSEDSSSNNNNNNNNMFTTSPVHTGSLLHHASCRILTGGGIMAPPAESSSRAAAVAVVAPLDSEMEEVAALVLKCLAHLFTWIPLSNHISPRLLTLIFRFASLGSQSKDSVNDTLAILAMGAINEIMYKNCVPPDFEDFLLQMFKNTFTILQSLVADPKPSPSSNSSSSQPKLHLINETYLDKFTEFLRSFVSTHLRRFEGNSQFPVLEFLALLFKYTFQQPSLESFYSCLEIWTIIVDYILGCFANRRSEGVSVLARYNEALLSLVLQILKKLQFKFNQLELEKLDNVTLNDDNETEWQHFIKNCIEVIMKVAEVSPSDVLRILEGTWKENSHIYLQLGKYISPEKKLVFDTEVEYHRLHCILRDFCTLLQIVGRLSSLCIGEAFLERLGQGLEFLKQLIELASFGSRHRLYTLQLPLPILVADFIDVHAHTLAALKAWCFWLAQLHSLSLKHPGTYEAQCRDLTSRIMVAVAPVIKDADKFPNDDKIVHSAAHFMVTLTGTVRPPSIWKLKEFTELFNEVTSHLKLKPDAHRLMVRSLANVLLLHWPGIAEQRWDEREKHLNKFLRDLTEDFRKIRHTVGFEANKSLQNQAKGVVSHTLLMLGDLVENVLNEVTQTKKLCHDCIREYIEIALWLFPIYLGDSEICENLFSFFHVIFDVLKSQMGADFVERVIQTFLTLFTKEQLSQTILNEGQAGVKVIEKFLGILEFVVKEPGASFRKFIPNTLSLCLEHIYPLVAEKPSSDIKGPLYSLLYNILLHNWQYFFKSSVVRTLGEARGEDAGVHNQEQFMAIMQAFGQSFLQPDIAVFKQNLAALEHLNAKWKLYHKAIFTQSLITQFLTVFLQVLIHRSHDLLREEIVISIHAMASVDFAAFFSHFLERFLAEMDGLDNIQRGILKQNFKTETDLPTFTANTNRFVNDLSYYRLCNASLPDGSVKF